MSDSQLKIRPLDAQDIPQVVEIFSDQFPNLSWTRLGKNFIRRFIRWHYEEHPLLSFVAVVDGQVIGFIIGATGGHREYYQRVVRSALPEFLLGTLLHPRLLFNRNTLVQWLDLLSSPRLVKANPEEIGMSKSGEKKAIVCFEAVTKAAQRHGIATSLGQAFRQAAFQAGIEVLSSYTEINNYPARRLHEKRGWKQVREDTRRKMVYYSKRLDKNS
jgi:ribosomal protein S18 acetylase RimI-like enzyme